MVTVKRRAIAILDWVVRLFVKAPPHPLVPPRWRIIVRPDGSKAFSDRYGERTDIEIIESASVPQNEVYLIDSRLMEAMAREALSKPLIDLHPRPEMGNRIILPTGAIVPSPTKLIITGA